MDWNSQIILVWILIWAIIGYLFARLLFGVKLRWQRKNAVERSKHVVMWQVNEKIAPILPWFPYNYKDLVFIWKWIDYIVFDWLSTGYLKQIVFLEIKSGNSNLNRNESMIQDCLSRKKVFYDILRIRK
jgi:predicted Holliday junction resolvase-like endonuclease